MLVLVGFSASSRKSSKGEIEVGWRGAIHSQELTHFGNRQQLLVRSGCCFPLVGLLGSTMPCSALGVRNFQARVRTCCEFRGFDFPSSAHQPFPTTTLATDVDPQKTTKMVRSNHPNLGIRSPSTKLHSGPHIPETRKIRICANVVGQNGPPTALHLHRSVTMTLIKWTISNYRRPERSV